MQSKIMGPLDRTVGTVTAIGLAFLPGLMAALPLGFNGAQHTLSALGRAEMPEGATASLGWGLAMLGAAALPFVAAPVVLAVGRARRLPGLRTARICAGVVLCCGLFACAMATVSAGV
ncbi:hypothetical protein [Streptomyces sp. 35G-GA-8]|uniref:hypothetical protein n=1 Tax=Streptomyces sp. 35G-GA-8 TaxID=2939434 RepID=UPI00201F6F46|nr:hypothetical protein [Streptomyces sp. 35G-GA-8]MCL7382314.1 hypothetical protein [Streptomyces sp. 35G-GA-8]